ncbi:MULTISPECIES: PilT/PilU family type 4a pilus ATPase [Alteromonadaceae]|uniref:PilT/PilU family type 4a pilus ATPase n=1 Tax=Alteromonadaceae TaxID=72275 RepID=UPI001C0A1CC5|nr:MULTISPECIES: PilT/PilU family type 4a pilus ATPase [Aliiglaciecola]MBU2876587.1 PilT/PilU family type 4a pilus ATPase [Aliiglaciecola lipolytica]MDO6711478.1 PilT/PilU family type 4a pilus ATPase [Aliiglaciecola sp. 2_MG-2023]MDO6752545.1 PilT/PilU family type 4a pilus ATPase [Aliiglaciecola sp. 1_MG-2023]
MDLNPYLRKMAEQGASDLFITVGFPISAKINGQMTPINDERLSEEAALALVHNVMSEKQQDEFNNSKECNFAIARDGIGRFRCSAFWQRDMAGMVVRRIVTQIPKADELGLPEILKDVIMSKRGLLLFVGATGTGKSTSLAALMGHRNQNSRGHILTIEDPIEFVHEHAGCVVTQREVGIDTRSFDDALKSSLRQAPDVILIGEIRSMETMEYAMSFADTGHLCVATLHANNANQAIERIMHLAPPEQHEKLRFDLSLNLRAIVAQQLVPTIDGKGRVAAIEILLNSPLVTDLIQRNEIGSLKEAMKKGKEMGMQSFDMALYELYKQERISMEQAIHHADSPNDLRLMIKLDTEEGTGLGSLSNVSIDMD